MVTTMFQSVSLLPMERSGLVVHGVLNPFSIAKTYNRFDRGRPETAAVYSVLL